MVLVCIVCYVVVIDLLLRVVCFVLFSVVLACYGLCVCCVMCSFRFV